MPDFLTVCCNLPTIGASQSWTIWRDASCRCPCDVHVILHQFAEVFCLEELMVLVRMTMAWVFGMRWWKGSMKVKCLAPTDDKRKVYHRTNPSFLRWDDPRRCRMWGCVWGRVVHSSTAQATGLVTDFSLKGTLLASLVSAKPCRFHRLLRNQSSEAFAKVDLNYAHPPVVNCKSANAIYKNWLADLSQKMSTWLVISQQLFNKVHCPRCFAVDWILRQRHEWGHSVIVFTFHTEQPSTSHTHTHTTLPLWLTFERVMSFAN